MVKVKVACKQHSPIVVLGVILGCHGTLAKVSIEPVYLTFEHPNESILFEAEPLAPLTHNEYTVSNKITVLKSVLTFAIVE